jgi:hypothetical protein
VSTREIKVVEPAGPPVGFGVNALAPVAEPAMLSVPSRTSAGVAATAGLTSMLPA